MTGASELVRERAELLARVEQINEALDLLGDPAAPVEIDTRRNLRNTGGLWDVTVYADASLTELADPHYKGGFITAEDAALLTEEGYVDGDLIRIVAKGDRR